MQHLIARSSTWENVDPAVKRVTNAKKYTGIFKLSNNVVNGYIHFDTNRMHEHEIYTRKFWRNIYITAKNQFLILRKYCLF